MRRHVNCGVRRKDRPCDALRVFFVIVGDRVRALVRRKGRANLLRRLWRMAIGEGNNHQVYLELASLDRRRAHWRKILRGRAPDRRQASFMRRDMRMFRLLRASRRLFGGNGIKVCGSEKRGNAENGQYAGIHGSTVYRSALALVKSQTAENGIARSVSAPYDANR